MYDLHVRRGRIMQQFQKWPEVPPSYSGKDDRLYIFKRLGERTKFVFCGGALSAHGRLARHRERAGQSVQILPEEELRGGIEGKPGVHVLDLDRLTRGRQ